MKLPVTKCTMLLVCVMAFASTSFGQSGFAAGAKVSTLGYGFEAATVVTERSNVRAGFNFFSNDQTLTRDGLNYDGQLRLRSVEFHYDWFLGHGFHVSPGLLLYNGDHIDAALNVPPGGTFRLGSQTYTQSTSPITGTAKAELGKKVAPMITAGFGNLLRTGRRWSINLEAGLAFKGSPKANLDLRGVACPAGGGANPCVDVASNPQVQSDIAAEENKINSGIAPYDSLRTITRYYPVFSIGVGYRFK